jgi:peptide/nickel transport system permease protein
VSNIAPALPPLDITRAPEGGAVGPVQSGWRLAVREFAHNRLAVIGLAILVFFVLFCFAGPLFYHGNVLNSDLSSSNLSPGGGHPLGTTDQGSTSSAC